MAPEEVAEVGYKPLMAGGRVTVAGTVNKLMVFSRHLMPGSAQAKKNGKMYEKVHPEKVIRVSGEIREKETAGV
ncbi:MAG TPA: hypothetical protein VG734_11520 [Lacunisphaera sp.]|jgi:short-subunit dehydrogenase|nr:hypothetical protein [Lacunisphaera sp.]